MIDRIRKTFINQRGFTLMELLIVIAIIAILTVAFLPNALNAPKKARDAVRVKKVQDIQTAVEAYVAENQRLPVDATGVIADGTDGDNNGGCFTQAVWESLGMGPVLDDGKLDSCGAGGADTNKYFFKSRINGTAAERHYFIGVKVEVPTSANASTTMVELNGVVNLADALATKQSVKPVPILANEEAWFIAVGPI